MNPQKTETSPPFYIYFWGGGTTRWHSTLEAEFQRVREGGREEGEREREREREREGGEVEWRRKGESLDFRFII